MKDMKHIEFERLLQGLGPVIRLAVGEAIEIIRKEAAIFTANAKVAYDPHKTDIVTSADRAAQAHYARRFNEAFPGIGLLGEEDGLRQACAISVEGKPVNIYITIDPLDGTKAFARQMSYGVGTMVGVVYDGRVIAAYVGDVNTGEVYGFAPDAPAPTRVRFGVETVLAPDTKARLADRYIMLNNVPRRFPANIQAMVGKPAEGGLFKDVDVMGGSYGVFMARLWKGEVAMAVLDPAHSTPWDETPVLGINRALGFIFIKVHNDGMFEVFDPELPLVTVPTLYNTIVVHKDYTPKILEYLRR